MDYAIASVFVYKSNSEQSFDLDKPVLSFIPTLLYTDFTKRPQQPFELTPLEHVVVSLIHWLLLPVFCVLLLKLPLYHHVSLLIPSV